MSQMNKIIRTEHIASASALYIYIYIYANLGVNLSIIVPAFID